MFVRLGMSESSLLMLYFIEHFIKGYNKKLLIEKRKWVLDWFFSTSGYFDVEVKGRLFEFTCEYDTIMSTKTYNAYFKELLLFVKHNTFDEFYMKCHDLGDLDSFIPIFYNFVHKTNSLYKPRKIMHKELNGKRILLMHNLSDLMLDQYNNGNVQKIYPHFPNVDIIVPFKIGYTFMNTPLNECKNIIERADLIEHSMNNYIEQHNINLIVISCGAYSNIFAQKMHKKGIPYIMIGGELEHEFGIIIQRHCDNKEINEYFIRVPDELKPENHHMIENGCYW